jgi:hypothetical protein
VPHTGTVEGVEPVADNRRERDEGEGGGHDNKVGSPTGPGDGIGLGRPNRDTLRHQLTVVAIISVYALIRQLVSTL